MPTYVTERNRRAKRTARAVCLGNEDVGISISGFLRDEIDATIRQRFGETWEHLATIECEHPDMEPWIESPKAVLGLLILFDQFSRNMFREDARAFATDKRARAAAKKAIEKGWDMRVPEPARHFFYTPLMHSECQMDQDRAVRLIKTRMVGDEGRLVHARVHREIIRKFGRFPYRNSALGRENTEAEAEFLKNSGYGAILHEFQGAVPA